MKLFTGVRIIFSSLILVGLVLGMQACGGGIGFTPVNKGNAADPTGYYDNTGTITVDDDGAGGGDTVINDLQAMINGNRFMMVSDTEGLFYDGTITSISINDFAANVSVYKHGQLIATPAATIAGTITEKSNIEGSVTGEGAGNSKGIFRLQYASNNNLAADVTRIDKNSGSQWARPIGGGTSVARFELTSGNISGPASPADGFFTGCDIGSGTFTPISGTSLYEVTMNVTNCTTNPSASSTYVGLGTSWNSSGTDDRLAVGVTDVNSMYAIHANFRPF